MIFERTPMYSLYTPYSIYLRIMTWQKVVAALYAPVDQHVKAELTRTSRHMACHASVRCAAPSAACTMLGPLCATAYFWLNSCMISRPGRESALAVLIVTATFPSTASPATRQVATYKVSSNCTGGFQGNAGTRLLSCATGLSYCLWNRPICLQVHVSFLKRLWKLSGVCERSIPSQLRSKALLW